MHENEVTFLDGGTWTVNFDLDKAYTGNAYLAIAVTGGVGNVAVAVNGHAIGDLSYGDDASVRRAANRSGRYGRNEYTFPAGLLKQGTNTLGLRNSSAGAGGALMYDTFVMETD